MKTTAAPSSPRGRSLLLIAALGGLLFWALVLGWQWGGAAGTPAAPPAPKTTEPSSPAQGPVALDELLPMFRSDPASAEVVLERVFDAWDPRYTAPLLELDHIVGAARPFRIRLMARLAEAWGLDQGGAVRDQRDALRQALWAESVEPLPGYAAWKANLYARIDPRFHAYFDDFTDAATVRLDEVQWGGVRRDGIPPLVGPETATADDAAAGYLGDEDVVFGVEVNGEARAYPKRILAWHEMVKDQLGGRSINGVYCTLCGSMIVYDTLIDGRHHELGTSGFLYRSNKLMYDRATESMWSTITGEPVIGPLVGRGLKLHPLSVVTTTWAHWKALHPQTTVLTLETGHRRDYGEGAAYRGYFATDELMFQVPGQDKRLKNKDEVLALRFGDPAAGPMALASKFLETRPFYAGEHGGQVYVVLTDASGAHRVYDRAGVVFAAFDGDRTVAAEGGDRWTLTEEAMLGPGGQSLPRLPSHNAFWFGWHAAHPDTALIRE